MRDRRTSARWSAAASTSCCAEEIAVSWLMAAVYDGMMRASEEAWLAQWRAELLREWWGAVPEIAAGTGATLSLYPNTVTRLVMSEPDPHMRRKLEAKRSANVEIS